MHFQCEFYPAHRYLSGFHQSRDLLCAEHYKCSQPQDINTEKRMEMVGEGGVFRLKRGW